MWNQTITTYAKSLREQFLAKRLSRDFSDRLDSIVTRWPIAPDTEGDFINPVFILASSWRSGSTLLQRMLMGGNPNLVIWGEPFDKSNLVTSMRAQLTPFTKDWPPERYFFKRDDNSFQNEWIANLYPDVEFLRQAHRKYFLTLFQESAEAMGKGHWGIKEVRLGYDDAIYLRWLFPAAKFIFLYRNPLAAYSSYQRFGHWYSHWPDRKVVTPMQFGGHWRRLTMGFLDHGHRVHSVFVRYEDLNHACTIRKIEDFLGFSLAKLEDLHRLDGRRQTTRPRSGRDSDGVTRWEKAIVRAAVGTAAKRAGYEI